jgi:hypothetical protein
VSAVQIEQEKKRTVKLSMPSQLVKKSSAEHAQAEHRTTEDYMSFKPASRNILDDEGAAQIFQESQGPIN